MLEQDELLTLMREKLTVLERSLILETDAAVKFKLKHEIADLKQQLADQESVGNMQSISSTNRNKIILENPDEIFISYGWGGESERIVNQLERSLQDKGLHVIRDKHELGFKANIKEFMQRIGRGRFVITVISDKYLKSLNCMRELLNVADNGDFYNRIFPIVLADANIYKAVKRIAYIQHWENEIAELDAAMKTVNAANLQGIRDDIDLYTKIREMIANLINIIQNMNVLTPEMHENDNFEALYHALEQARSQYL